MWAMMLKFRIREGSMFYVMDIWRGMMKPEARAGKSIIPRCPTDPETKTQTKTMSSDALSWNADARGLRFAIVVARFNCGHHREVARRGARGFDKSGGQERRGFLRSRRIRAAFCGAEAGQRHSMRSLRWER